MKYTYSLLILNLVLLQYTVSYGADADPKAIYDKASELFDAGDFEKAAVQFRAAYKAKPTWKILYNIGQSEAAAKHHGAAFEAFEQYISEGGDDIANARHDEVTKELERLHPLVGSVEIETDIEGDVYIDDFMRVKTPLVAPIKVSVGVVHVVTVVNNGQTVFKKRIKVSSGETVTIDTSSVEIESESLAENGAADDAVDNDAFKTESSNQMDVKLKKLKLAGIILAGSGGAFIVAGTITGISALSINSDLKSVCDGTTCPDDQNGKISKLDTLTPLSTIFLSAGGALATTGIALLITYKIRKRRNSSSAKQLNIFPSVFSDGGAIFITGRF
ncbi:MAG: tetratricopeptide repeat protein [Deltaproteobacteria bacterium]|nr:tetratricopeptide repeat protein [Deltaproteobacteria bacterium]